MKEIKDIIAAYDDTIAQGKQAVLATVVHVEGSSYRRPGARMLVTEDGMLTGAISGGCLEGDALRKALLALHENRNKLITYDTTDDDDAAFGIQLGCNGIVHILFEPLKPDNPNAISLLKKATAIRKNAALTTLFSLDKNSVQHGTILSISDDTTDTATPFSSADLERSVIHDAHTALASGNSSIKKYIENGKEVHAFIQVVQPSVSLVIFGAGNDAAPLVSIAHLTGWETTVIDGRHTHATKKRFPKADRVFVSKAVAALNNVTIDKLTVFVLMTHNYNYDISILRQLLPMECSYIGILGPAKKLERMFDDLAASGTSVAPGDMKKIFSPVGLDIGAETAEEIALSVAAEIHAVLAGKDARSLKQKRGPIHSRNEQPISHPAQEL